MYFSRIAFNAELQGIEFRGAPLPLRGVGRSSRLIPTEDTKESVRPKPRSYEEVFTPEEAKRMGIGGRIDGPGDWKPDPNAAKNVREFIEKGGNTDPAGDAIQDGDYHDLLDQNGGPEGF